ncbi:hypothetical protein ALC56_00002, partial [Trachymyrmex septentrionalis]
PWHIYLDEKKPLNKEHLLHTLTYEIGHSLELTHSSRKDAIMFAFITNNNNKTVNSI